MNDRIKELANLAGWKYILGGNPRTRIEDRDYIVKDIYDILDQSQFIKATTFAKGK